MRVTTRPFDANMELPCDILPRKPQPNTSLHKRAHRSGGLVHFMPAKQAHTRAQSLNASATTRCSGHGRKTTVHGSFRHALQQA